MNEYSGWISLYRCILNHWTARDKPYNFLAALCYLFLMANHKDNIILFDGKPLLVERGTFVTSISKLSNVFGWSTKKTRNFLRNLEVDGTVTIESTTRGTTITIVNYDVYQNVGTTNDITEEQLRNSSGTTKELLGNTNNNDNNGNNVNNDNNMWDTEPKRTRSQFKPPTLEEVQAYCRERNNKVDAERFIDYYSSNGWMVGKNKMKEWKAAVRTWERNQYSSNTEPKNSKPANGGNKSFKEIMMEMEQSEQQEDVYVESKDVTERSSNEY